MAVMGGGGQLSLMPLEAREIFKELKDRSGIKGQVRSEMTEKVQPAMQEASTDKGLGTTISLSL